MFIVLLDESSLFAFASPHEAVGAIEPIDAERELRAAFDSDGVPYRVERVHPKQGAKTFFGVFLPGGPDAYRFVPAGPADSASLIALLEAHPLCTPQAFEPELRKLLSRLRGV
jgi:hypothetical protein